MPFFVGLDWATTTGPSRRVPLGRAHGLPPRNRRYTGARP